MRLHPPIPADAASGLPEAATSPRRHATLRRRVLGAGVAAAILLLLVLTPPLINANRYRIRIADTMSASLGRPVHLDDVSFHILPVPGFTLKNLVVSEDPAFGSEPTIRANNVEATLRVSSLWRRPVEFSTVRFVEPSVNLVRNADGRWNLSDVLLHASRVNSAPTAQRHAGPAPRFPYIEATSGRVNVKLGAEKLPFSLTEADFALWLPSAQQWRVRLVGHPARTDTDITDPGTIRLEGELRRADAVRAVPVNFRASWHDAPLGEASRIITGEDRGWRGSLNVDATLTGILGDARMTSKLTLGGLRRAEFFPTRPLDLQITCGSGFQLHPASLTALQCTLPDEAPSPIELTADWLDPLRPGQGAVTMRGDAIPVRWALLWAALFSARVPTDLQPSGTLAIDLVHGPVTPSVAPALPRPPRRPGRHGAKPASAVAPGGNGWSGQLALRFPDAAQNETTLEGNTLTLQITSTADSRPTFTLLPTPVRLGPNAMVTLAATLNSAGYMLTVNGTAPPAALLLPARYLPQFGDGLEGVLPYPPTSTEPLHVAFTCQKAWSTAQRCQGPQPPVGAHSTPLVIQPARVLPSPPPAPLNLSPLERAPFSTPRPQSPPTGR